jgi:imidazolonepropionase-like amidohydrolase
MQNHETVIHAGRLLATPGEAPKRDQSLWIADGKIKSLTAGFIDPPPGTQLIDLKDKFVLPGLIDCHVHLTGQLGANSRLRLVEDSDPKVALDAAQRAQVTLAAGFTTVRDVGALSPEVIYALRAATAEGKVPGPRILCVGAILSPTGGHGQAYGYRADVCACIQSSSGVCDGVDACRRAVRTQVAQGADAIKFVATGGVLSDLRAGVDQQFADDEIRSIIETAHRLGRRVSAHAHGTAGINAALAAGVDSIEHGSFLDDTSIKLFLERPRSSPV